MYIYTYTYTLQGMIHTVLRMLGAKETCWKNIHNMCVSIRTLYTGNDYMHTHIHTKHTHTHTPYIHACVHTLHTCIHYTIYILPQLKAFSVHHQTKILVYHFDSHMDHLYMVYITLIICYIYYVVLQ